MVPAAYLIKNPFTGHVPKSCVVLRCLNKRRSWTCVSQGRDNFLEFLCVIIDHEARRRYNPGTTGTVLRIFLPFAQVCEDLRTSTQRKVKLYIHFKLYI